MSELDLSKAYEAAEKAAHLQGGDMPWYIDIEEAVDAALPHILEALATHLDTQIDLALLGGDEDDVADTEWQEHALDWLRRKAEELQQA